MIQIKTYPEMNEIIKNLLRLSDEPMNLYILARIEELEKQVSDLTQSPPNDPLTIEQLREMGKDPEPIYIPGHGWRICYGVEDLDGKSTLMVGVTARIFLDNYGDGFVAYRRKPEEGKHETNPV